MIVAVHDKSVLTSREVREVLEMSAVLVKDTCIGVLS